MEKIIKPTFVSLKELLTLDITNKVICFPTDTVYGVSAKYDDLEAINRIYQMKKRDSNKPLAILTANRDISSYVEVVSEKAQELMDKNWPGALTLIFKKSSKIDSLVTRGKETIAFRMPNSKIALQILDKFGLMATTSVNISGEKELNDIWQIADEFSSYIDYIVTDKSEFLGKPSEVIDVTSEEIKVIRKI